jgi:hypothetical protein
MSRHHVIIASNGNPCPRCGQPIENPAARLHHRSRAAAAVLLCARFICRNACCRTTVFVPARYRVFNVEPETERRMAQIAEQLGLPESSAQALDCGRHTNVRISSYKL